MAVALVCPKCQGQLRPLERSGLTVDQCDECGGIFLDRGELERLMQAEDAHYGAGPAPASGYPPPGPPGYPPPPQNYPPKRRKRGGFLEDLFDF